MYLLFATFPLKLKPSLHKNTVLMIVSFTLIGTYALRRRREVATSPPKSVLRPASSKSESEGSQPGSGKSIATNRTVELKKPMMMS